MNQTRTMGLGDLLVSEEVISGSQLETALAEQHETNERLGEILCRKGWVTQNQLMSTLARQLGIRHFDPTRDEVQVSALELVPVEFARRHDVLPVSLDSESFTVAMSDPMNVEALDHLKRIAARKSVELDILLGRSETLESSREKGYGWIEGDRNVSQLIEQVMDEVGEDDWGLDGVVLDDGEAGAQDAGIVNLVDQVIVKAVKERATDIHIEPQKNGLVIRYRIDGVLVEALSPPKEVYNGVVSRLKILSNMDIAEKRTAQDGRFSFTREGHSVDVRASIVPTINGEKFVLRLLNKSGFKLSLNDLGYSEDDATAFRNAINQPYGMVLLSGPTGSGKTTTLYSGLLELKGESLNITTIEDPVEYQIDRINQVQVNERKDITFATALRSFLRQDPDVIMVGEIRDQETADIAIRAALTGHMVFSTIHANDAPATATRLLSMGVEPFMASSALTMVAAQRLVRRNCPHCLVEYTPTDEALFALGLMSASGDDWGNRTFVRGEGCVACNGRGYRGRVAIVERMLMTPPLRQMIAEGRPASEIRDQALDEGMNTLRDSGLQKVLQGETTIEEVLRVCISEG